MSERIRLEDKKYPIFKDKEAKLNQYISLKLENGKTNLYLNNKRFKQCNYLILHFFVEQINELNDIQSIDDMEKIDHSGRFNYHRHVEISPQEEFWGHCSNLQAWIENDYNTRLLHRSLAFPLLRELSYLGDPKARNMFKNEIIERFSSQSIPVMLFLLLEGFLNDFSNEEREFINEGLDKIFTTSFFAKNLYPENYDSLFDEDEIDDNLEKYHVQPKLLSKQYTRRDLDIVLPPFIQKTPGEEISDITDIPELKINTDYTALGLFQNRISEIKGFDNLTYLRQLGLNHNEITEIKNLDKCKKLRLLDLPGNQISEIKGLDNLKELEFLNLDDNKITRIKGLENLINLKVLNLWKNRIKKIEGLENLTDLRILNLMDNEISEIEGLENLTNLRQLMLDGNQISEIKGLDNLNNLRRVTFQSNNIFEIRGLDKLPNLKEVVLRGNPLKEDYVNKFKVELENSGGKTKYYFPFYFQGEIF